MSPLIRMNQFSTCLFSIDPSEKYSTFLKSRPQKMEEVAIEQVISLCEKTKVRKECAKGISKRT